MRCQKVKRKLSAFLDGELSEKKASRIAEHLSGCQNCQQEVAFLSSLWERLEEMREVDPSPYFWTRLNARITQAEERSFSLDRVRGILDRLLVPATAIAALVVGLWIGGALYEVHWEDKPNLWEQATASLYLDALDDFPAQSIGLAYTELVFD